MPAPFILNTSPIDEETRQIAERELNETPERVASATAELRCLLQEATDLHFYDDDEFLLTFLRPCHFYPESALNLVSEYLHVRSGQIYAAYSFLCIAYYIIRL